MPVYTDGEYHGPGVYRGQKLAPDGVVNFAPGTYIVEQGLEISGGNGMVGTGIFIYNGCAADAPPGCTSNGTFRISGSGYADATAQTTGPYAGILLYQAQDNTAKVDLSGGSGLGALDGLIYVPATQKLNLSGESTLDVLGVIANIVGTSGGAAVQVGF